MYGIVDFVWKPSEAHPTPPAGKAPAIVRGDPYDHGIVVAGGWDALGGEEFQAQLRLARLTGATAGDATADFTIVNERGVYDDSVDPATFTETVDGEDLRIMMSLTAEVTLALPASLGKTNGFVDMQQVDGSTIISGKARVLDDVTRIVA